MVSNSGVKYRAKKLPTKSGKITSGEVSQRSGRALVRPTMASRRPGTPSPRAAGNARSASVVGAPSTSRIGASIPSVMCTIMCRENCASA